MAEEKNVKLSVLITESIKSYLQDSLQHLDPDLHNEVNNYLSSFEPNGKNFIPINFLKNVYKVYNFQNSGESSVL